MLLRRLRSVAALGAVLSVGTGFWACSADTTVSGDDTGDDSGTTQGTGDGGGDSTFFSDGSGGGDDASSGGDAKGDARSDGSAKDSGGDGSHPDSGVDAAVDCGPAPTFGTTAEGVVCPFQADGSTPACTASQHCCVYAKSAGVDSTCNAGGSACLAAVDAGGADFECDEPADCNGASAVCCLTGAVMNDPTCYHFGSGVKGTTCRTTACNTGEVTLCSAQGDCPMNTTCTAFTTKTKSLGACL